MGRTRGGSCFAEILNTKKRKTEPSSKRRLHGNRLTGDFRALLTVAVTTPTLATEAP